MLPVLLQSAKKQKERMAYFICTHDFTEEMMRVFLLRIAHNVDANYIITKNFVVNAEQDLFGQFSINKSNRIRFIILIGPLTAQYDTYRPKHQ